MNIVNKIFEKLGYQKKATSPPPTAFEPDAYAVNFESAPKMKSSEYLKAARGWVFTAISAIADRVASIELRLYRQTKKGIEQVINHPILDVLYKVNSFTTKFDHFWITQAYLELTGESPWYVERVGKRIVGLYFLKPDKLSIKLGKEGQIVEGYDYLVGLNKKIPLASDEVIFLRQPDPAKPLRGLGTLEAVARTVDLDNYAEEWNKNFFFNAARPASILNIKIPNLTEQQRAELKKSIQENYQGLNKAHRMMVLFGDMEHRIISPSQKDMDFLNQQRFSRDKILGIFRVPKAVVAQTEGVNLASAKVANFVFNAFTIAPKMERLVEQLNEFLVPMFPNSEDLFLDYVSPVAEDKNFDLELCKVGMQYGILSTNEARAILGKSPLKEGGDDIYKPMNLMPTGSAEPATKVIRIGTANPPTEEEIKVKEQRLRYLHIKNASKEELRNYKSKELKQAISILREKIREIIKGQLKKSYKRQNKKEFPKKTEKEFGIKKKEAFWRAQIKVSERIEKVFIKRLVELFDNQEKEILKILRGQKGIIDDVLLSTRKETAIFVTVLSPLIERTMKKEGNIAIELVNPEAVFSVDAPPVRNYIKNNTRKFSKEINETTNEQLKETLQEGIEQGEGTNDLTKRVKEVFRRAKRNRAAIIARTEIIKASNAATEQAYVQSGVVEGKEWLTAFDERTCEACMAMNGKTMALNKNYFNKGDKFMGIHFDYDSIQYPPLHCNCRCTLLPVVKSSSS